MKSLTIGRTGSLGRLSNASPRLNAFAASIMDGLPTLFPDFREFLLSFAAREVRYMIVGGYALAYHGRPRYTGDIDAWVEPTAENSRRAVAALEDFGFASLGLDPDTFSSGDVIVQVGRPPLRIDVLTSPSGVSFGECYPNRLQVNDSGLMIDVVGLACLKANKAASGRTQDLADLESLGGASPESR